ncbi:MAG: transglycosylase family protein, partial [Luteibacter sp.]
WPARISVVSIVSAAAFAIGTMLWEAPLEATPAPDLREALELKIPPLRPSTARENPLTVAPMSAPAFALAPITPTEAQVVDTTAAAMPEEPEGPMYSGKEVTVVGDSVMLGAKRVLTALLPGTDLHATMGWQAADVLRQIQSLKKNQVLRPVVVVHLGTNGYITEQQLRQILGLLSACKRVVLVNTRVPRRWMASNNELIDQVAPEFPNVRVVRWSDISDRKPEYFISDRVHLTAIGQRALIADVVRAGYLGRRDPLPGPSDNAGVKPAVKDGRLPERLLATHAAESDAFWLNIAQCETGSDWHEYSRSLGGLDIGLGAWSMWGGEAFAPTPSEATRDQQIVVAKRISTQGWTTESGERVKPIGLGHWKCAAVVESSERTSSTHGRD